MLDDNIFYWVQTDPRDRQFPFSIVQRREVGDPLMISYRRKLTLVDWCQEHLGTNGVDWCETLDGFVFKEEASMVLFVLSWNGIVVNRANVSYISRNGP